MRETDKGANTPTPEGVQADLVAGVASGRYLTSSDVAALLDIDANSVVRLLENGKLQGVRLGQSKAPKRQQWLIARDAVEDYKRAVAEAVRLKKHRGRVPAFIQGRYPRRGKRPDGALTRIEAATALGMTTGGVSHLLNSGRIPGAYRDDNGQWVLTAEALGTYKGLRDEWPEGALTRREAADALGISVEAVAYLLYSGQLEGTYHDTHGRRVIPASAITAYKERVRHRIANGTWRGPQPAFLDHDAD
jgi:hypothetical protein